MYIFGTKLIKLIRKGSALKLVSTYYTSKPSTGKYPAGKPTAGKPPADNPPEAKLLQAFLSEVL
jgi:hypothetical protein